MYAAPPYGGAQPGYGGFYDTRTPPPPNSGHYYPQPPPRHATTAFQGAGPMPRSFGNPKAHARRASQQMPGYSSYSPRMPPMYSSDPRFASAHYASPLRNPEFDRSAPKPEQPATPKANQARQRRASYAPRPTTTPPKPKPSPQSKSRKANEEDARKAGIPAGYSIKNWDPSEEPIVLLGSVFDANSLGKWIYDWTVYSYGPATPMADVAGEMWLLLIQLAGKVKRADEAIDKIRQEENRELVEDFLESGERLWVRFKKLLKICEEYMWKAAQRETGEKRPVAMGKNSGCEFVEAIFGRDRELDKTEKLMSNIRLWSMRFDANCDEIIRNPAA